jgi:hypothetical protein
MVWSPPIDPAHWHGQHIRHCIDMLHRAIRDAKQDGLRVELQLAAFVTIADDRDSPFDPYHAVKITRDV